MTDEKEIKPLIRSSHEENLGDDYFSWDPPSVIRAQAKNLKPSCTPSESRNAEFSPNAIVISHTRKYATVLHQGEERLCLLDDGLQEGNESLLAPGDEVYVEEKSDEWFIRWIAPRRTKISKPDSHTSNFEQVLAANVDVLVIVSAAAKPPFREGLVDRFLILAQRGGVALVLCVNKMDLCDSPPEGARFFENLGIPTVYTSCVTKQGIADLLSHLKNRTAVFVGHSGVGKSSLINALGSAVLAKTGELSERDQGRHVTTLARLYLIPEHQVRIIDTPGLRHLGVGQIRPEELSWYFPDLAEIALQCRFRDCTHRHEPDCAVLAAVKESKIHPQRYQSYLRLLSSLVEQKVPPHRSPEKRKR